MPFATMMFMFNFQKSRNIVDLENAENSKDGFMGCDLQPKDGKISLLTSWLNQVSKLEKLLELFSFIQFEELAELFTETILHL